MPTWDELIAADPDLANYEIDAQQAGRNRVVGWLCWLKTFGQFVGVLKRLERDHQGARAVVLDHLTDVFERAAGRR